MTPEQIVTLVMMDPEFEGGDTFTNDPLDRGGATRFGLAVKGFFSDYLGRRATVADLEALTPEVAVQVGLWAFRKWHVALLQDWRVQLVVYDYCFNAGTDDGIPALQRACGARVDGRLGPETAAKANALSAHCLVMRIVGARLRKHVNVSRTSGQIRFLRGWTRRCARLLEESSRDTQ